MGLLSHINCIIMIQFDPSAHLLTFCQRTCLASSLSWPARLQEDLAGQLLINLGQKIKIPCMVIAWAFPQAKSKERTGYILHMSIFPEAQQKSAAFCEIKDIGPFRKGLKLMTTFLFFVLCKFRFGSPANMRCHYLGRSKFTGSWDPFKLIY